VKKFSVYINKLGGLILLKVELKCILILNLISISQYILLLIFYFIADSWSISQSQERNISSSNSM